MKLLKLDSRLPPSDFPFYGPLPSRFFFFQTSSLGSFSLFERSFGGEFYILPLNLSPAILFLPTQLNTNFPFNSKNPLSQNSFFLPSSSRSIKKDLRKELASKNSRSHFLRIKNWKLEAREANAPPVARLARKDLHRPYVYHALLRRSCNLPAHYSTVYQRFRPSTTSLLCVLACISFNLFARGFIRSPRSSSSLASILPCLRFIRAADPNLSRPNFFLPRVQRVSRSQWNFASTKDLFSQGILLEMVSLSLSYERGGSFERLKMDFERGLLASSSLFFVGQISDEHFLRNFFIVDGLWILGIFFFFPFLWRNFFKRMEMVISSGRWLFLINSF